MDTSLHVFVCVQQTSDRRAAVYTTPITDLKAKVKTEKTKQDLAFMINGMRQTACHGNVSETYVTESISLNTIVMVLYEQKITVSGRGSPLIVEEPLGFILARPEDEGFYIDIICSKRNGGELLNYFIRFADGFGENVVLSSLPSVLSYYPKFKFKFRQSCKNPVLNTLPNSIAKRDKLVKPFPTTTEEAYEDKDYSDFMIRLHQRGLSQATEPPCNKKIISKGQMIAGDCGGDGYRMIRCRNDLAGGRRKTRKMRR